MYHSITIGEKNTWDDWHLIPKTRPLVNPPKVKTHYVNIPGGNGQLDLTEALTGKPTFENRTGSWTFIVENGFKPWSELFSEIMMYLHGRTMKAVLEDDPTFYYEGRFSVSNWDSGANWSTITIDYNLNPNKLLVYGYTDEWLWDPFNFETGVIRDYKNLELVSGKNLTVVVTGGSLSGTPIFITSNAGVKLMYNGKTYDLSKGRNIFDDIIVSTGDYTFVFTGTGTITIDCRGGML